MVLLGISQSYFFCSYTTSIRPLKPTKPVWFTTSLSLLHSLFHSLNWSFRKQSVLPLLKMSKLRLQSARVLGFCPVACSNHVAVMKQPFWQAEKLQMQQGAKSTPANQSFPRNEQDFSKCQYCQAMIQRASSFLCNRQINTQGRTNLCLYLPLSPCSLLKDRPGILGIGSTFRYLSPRWS